MPRPSTSTNVWRFHPFSIGISMKHPAMLILYPRRFESAMSTSMASKVRPLHLRQLSESMALGMLSTHRDAALPCHVARSVRLTGARRCGKRPEVQGRPGLQHIVVSSRCGYPKMNGLFHGKSYLNA